jgi:hypothetical protein
LIKTSNYQKKALPIKWKGFGRELGIRTPGPVTVNSFQDCRNRPLCQLSVFDDAKLGFSFFLYKSKLKIFFHEYVILLANG